MSQESEPTVNSPAPPPPFVEGENPPPPPPADQHLPHQWCQLVLQRLFKQLQVHASSRHRNCPKQPRQD
ncbi:hypothetical protein QYF36_005954 [Acer negundo]|nr:hypothetical protein QYF36_005954 [Acer negundo]